MWLNLRRSVPLIHIFSEVCIPKIIKIDLLLTVIQKVTGYYILRLYTTSKPTSSTALITFTHNMDIM